MPQTLNDSPLDNLLRQSLAIAMRARNPDKDVIDHLWGVLTRLARFYRTTGEVVSQSVIEPAASSIDVNGKALRCPRLLVQCARRDAVAPCLLTFLYTPEKTDTITLRIAHAGAVYEAPDVIQWIASHKGWCIAGSELGGAVHAEFVRRALYASDFFTANAMALEPLAP